MAERDNVLLLSLSSFPESVPALSSARLAAADKQALNAIVHAYLIKEVSLIPSLRLSPCLFCFSFPPSLSLSLSVYVCVCFCVVCACVGACACVRLCVCACLCLEFSHTLSSFALVLPLLLSFVS